MNLLDTLHANQLIMISMLKAIQTQEKTIVSALSDLQASTAALTVAVNAAISDIASLASQLATASAGNDDAGVEAVVTQLNQLGTNLQNAVTPPAAPPAS